MNVDLSRLEALTSTRLCKPPHCVEQHQSSAQAENAVQDCIGGVQGIPEAKRERQQADFARTAERYRAYQQNIARSGQLRTDIIKGVKGGESPYKLLLKAVECISLMTGDRLFLDATRADIKSIYGAGLLEAEPLQEELEEVQKRLVKLERAVMREGEPPGSRQRMQSAIKAHKERAAELRRLIGQG